MLNKVMLLGRMTKDPEIKCTSNNTMVAAFSLAVGRNYKKEGQPDTDFINIVAWGKTAEFVGKYFVKGQQVCVCGRLQTRNYDDKDGKKVYVTEVVAEEVHFADNKKTEYASVPQQDGFTTVTDSELPF